MPVNVVKTARDERLWRKAKAAARANAKYKGIDRDSDRWWSIVMGIFKRMAGRGGSALRKAAGE